MTIRKAFYLFGCLVLLASPVACKKQQASDNSDSDASQTTVSPATTTSGSDAGVPSPAAPADMGNQPQTPVGPGSTSPQTATPPENGINPNPDATGTPGNPSPASPTPAGNQTP